MSENLTKITIIDLLQNDLIVEKIFHHIHVQRLFSIRFVSQKFYNVIISYLNRQINIVQIDLLTTNDDVCQDFDQHYIIDDENDDGIFLYNHHMKNSLRTHLQQQPRCTSTTMKTLNFCFHYWLDDETLMNEIFLHSYKYKFNEDKMMMMMKMNMMVVGNPKCICKNTVVNKRSISVDDYGQRFRFMFTTTLENIYLDHCWNVTNNQLINIFSQCLGLRRLSLAHIYSIEDGLLKIIGKLLKQLEWINLKCCWRITDRGIAGYVL